MFICATRHGFVCANAGVDQSNASRPGELVLLPVDPDGSARRLRAELGSGAGRGPALVIADSFGRPWRLGQTDVAIGVAGLTLLDDWTGRPDAYGRELRVTSIAIADSAAAAADLARGKDSRQPGRARARAGALCDRGERAGRGRAAASARAGPVPLGHGAPSPPAAPANATLTTATRVARSKVPHLGFPRGVVALGDGCAPQMATRPAGGAGGARLRRNGPTTRAASPPGGPRGGLSTQPHYRWAPLDPPCSVPCDATEHGGAMATQEVTNVRLLDNYVGGAWTPATSLGGAAGHQPGDRRDAGAGAAVLGGRPRRRGGRRAGGPARVARRQRDRARAQAVRPARGARFPPRGPRPLGHHRDGQDDRRRPRRGRTHDRDGRGRLRRPDDDAGPDPRGRVAQRRRRDRPPAGRRLRRDRAVQLPRDGALLVPPVRDRLRQQLRPQALRAGPAHPADRLRAARRARPPARRRQPRQRRPRGRRGHPRPPGHRRGLVRRLGAGRPDRLRARRQGRQARPGPRRREEPHGRAPRRRHRQDRRRAHRLRLRRRRPALHGRLGRRHRRRRARQAACPAARGRRATSRSATGSTSRRQLGPVVSEQARERIVAAIEHGVEEGAELVARRPRGRRRRQRRMVPRRDDPGRGHARDGRRARGDLRPGPVGRAGGQPRRGDRDRQRLAFGNGVRSSPSRAPRSAASATRSRPA